MQCDRAARAIGQHVRQVRDFQLLRKHFALRLRADVSAGVQHKRWGRAARAFVLDASHSQSADTLDVVIRVTKAAFANFDSDDRFTVFACDSACVSYLEDGLAAASDSAIVHSKIQWFSP